MQGPLRLGVAERKITPPLGGYLYGYPSPPRSTAVHDDLTVTALYFEEGDTRALLLSFTICSLSSALCRRLAALLEGETGVPRTQIILHATHTHSGPSTTDSVGWGHADTDYIEGILIPAAIEDMQTPLSMIRPGGRIYEQRKATLDVLKDVEGLSFVKNDAAFYLFPKLDARKFNITSDRIFARDLLEATNILVVPGSGFEWPDPDHIRLVMLPKPEELRDAMIRMGNFLDGYRQA